MPLEAAQLKQTPRAGTSQQRRLDGAGPLKDQSVSPLLFIAGTQRDRWSYVVGHLFAPLGAGVFTVALYSAGNLLAGMAGRPPAAGPSHLSHCDGVAVEAPDIRGPIQGCDIWQAKRLVV